MKAPIIILLITALSVSLSAQQKPVNTTSIYFGGGSYYIDQEQVKSLYSFLDSYSGWHNYQIIIHSHTDNIGGKEYNDWLSRMRSEEVRQLILFKNIPNDIILIKDHGLHDPAYSNDNWEGRIRNRRVDIIVKPLA